MNKIIIIGKRNIGKSSLFNFFSKSNDSLSINYEGYTRDCIFKITKIGFNVCEIIDTPGVGFFEDELDILSVKKVWNLIKNCDLVLFLFDLFDLNNKLFFNISSMLKFYNLKVFYILNKIDILNEYDIRNFLYYNFNLSPILISIKQKRGLDILYNLICKAIFKTDNKSILASKFFKISIIGKQNVGKSLLSNRLVSFNKSIVYNLPGTTRDIIQSFVFKNNFLYLISDTPGIKKKFLKYSEFISNNKIFDYIRNNDMSLVIVDIIDIFCKSNLFIILNALKFCKFVLVLFNKSDKISKNNMIKIECKIKDSFYSFLNLNYKFISSRFLFNFENLLHYISDLKRMHKKIILSDFLLSIKNFVNNNINVVKKKLFIKSIFFDNFDKFTLNVILNRRKINYDDKRFLCALILKYLNFKEFSFKFRFN